MTDKLEETKSRLTNSDWLVISSLWERGEVTLKELSEKFSISEAAISQGLKRRGIKRGSKAHLVSKEIEKTVQEEKDKLVKEIYDFKKRFLRYGDFLMTLTMNEITEAKKSKAKLHSIKPELETIIAATKVYKTIRNDMYHLYDLYNPDNKPEENIEFNIGVYSEADIEALREEQEIYTKITQSRLDEDLDLDVDNSNIENDA